MAKIKNVIEIIERFAPLALQGDFDNCGLKTGDVEKEVTGILVTLDTNESVVKEAIDKKCNLIVEHHPSIFRSIKAIDYRLPLHRTLSLAIKYDIAVYSAHTNVDFTENGLNDYVAKQMGLSNITPIEKNCDPRIGTLSAPLSLENYTKKLKSIFNDEHIVSIGDPEKLLRKVAVVNGGGGSNEEDLLLSMRAGADVFVTGDVKYNVARLAKDAKYAIIQFGHYTSEQGFMPLMRDVLTASMKNVAIYETKSLENPYN